VPATRAALEPYTAASMIPPRRLLPSLAGALAVAMLGFPAPAAAHGIVGRADLPIPVWLFSWTAAVVLVVSFVALSSLWRSPRLQEQHRRVLLRVPRLLEPLAGLAGVGLFALVLYSGFAGAQVDTVNFSVTFIYVVFWVGMPVLSVLFGDVFWAFNPWRACARALRAGLRAIAPGDSLSSPPLRYPDRLGLWPAIAGLVGFAWLELVYVNRDQPSLLAALSLGYFLAMVAGMLLFGVERWEERADGFGVYFNLLSRLSALVWEDGVLYLRRPLSGLTDLPVRRRTVALLCTIIGTTTFDGFSNGGVWRTNEPSLESLLADLGLHQTPAQELAYSVGLVFCICVIAGVYRLGILGVHSVSRRYDVGQLTRAFAHTLAPIGFAYVLAHYFSLLIWQSQAMVYLSSDPLGNGANLLGADSFQINYHVISYAAIWYVQVAALLAGHVGGLTLAHDRALAMYSDPREAVRSQYWMLVVMVAFTSFGLWLLSAVGT
jgi:hypothetical protein